jgi:dolichol-phosphate mannosyltransferase
VEEFVARAVSALERVTKDWELIIVDDSDDATPDVVRKLRASGLRLVLVHRAPERRLGGLGGAVHEGFNKARGRVVAVMDGDLQHPPEILPALVAPVLSGKADLAVGTRYGPGGSAHGLAGPRRRFISAVSRRLVHALVPPARSLQDPLSGLFAFRRQVIDRVELVPKGYKILLELVVRGRWRSTVNVPFAFGRRHGGSSKADIHEGCIFLRHLASCAIAVRRLQPPSSAESCTSYVSNHSKVAHCLARPKPGA